MIHGVTKLLYAQNYPKQIYIINIIFPLQFSIPLTHEYNFGIWSDAEARAHKSIKQSHFSNG